MSGAGVIVCSSLRSGRGSCEDCLATQCRIAGGLMHRVTAGVLLAVGMATPAPEHEGASRRLRPAAQPG